MNARRMVLTVAACAAGFAAAAVMGARPAQPGSGGGGGQANVRDQSRPVRQHAELQKLVGEYTTLSKLAVGDMDPLESAGTAKVSAMLDGRFVALEEVGETMGLPTRSFKLFGFNSESKKYESVWTYTRSTAMMTLVGTGDEDARSFTLEGGYDEADGRSLYRITFKRTGEGTFVLTMAALASDNSAVATLETTYTRKN
ncbi:MAG: DUF1579 family protein [Phycisphaeraceae bacterium]|nr:DUF1579 family protein [Phycisphaeraceae bacterium]MBX3407267.1 DUF1579 family protein [Phycisphaeraceae bacterium]